MKNFVDRIHSMLNVAFDFILLKMISKYYLFQFALSPWWQPAPPGTGSTPVTTSRSVRAPSCCRWKTCSTKSFGGSSLSTGTASWLRPTTGSGGSSGSSGFHISEWGSGSWGSPRRSSSGAPSTSSVTWACRFSTSSVGQFSDLQPNSFSSQKWIIRSNKFQFVSNQNNL